MEPYYISEFTFVPDESGHVDVLFGSESVGSFTIPNDADRFTFIVECEEYYATEMIFA